MKLFKQLVASFLFVHGVPLYQDAAHAAEPVPLFDGKTFSGWEGNIGSVWRIEEDALTAGALDKKQEKNDFLATTKEFEDFELTLKWKLEGTDGFVNGGVQFRSQRIPNHHEVSGYQADLGAGFDGALYDESRRNKVLVKPTNEVLEKAGKTLGEWNEYRIRAEGNRIQLWLNGVQTVDYTEAEANIAKKGVIAVQIHGNATSIVRYKDLAITELGPPNSLNPGSDGKEDFGDSIQFRGELSNAYVQFTQTKQGRVAFMGGSITEMNGYRPMVCDILQKRFPTTEFTFIDAGISSTCSTTGAARLQRDVLSKGPIDLFFVEFAVNDDQDAHHTHENCIRGLEGIIRQARTVNPNIDIVVTYFVNEGMLEKLQTGKTPLTIEAHDAVAKHYAISTINLAKEVAEEISNKTITWAQFGGVHPAPFGNAIAAQMIDKLFGKAWISSTVDQQVQRPHAMPTPLDKFSYSHFRFIEPGQAIVQSGWQLGIPDWESLPGSKRPRFTDIPMLFTNEVGAELSLAFDGTAIGAFIVAGPDAGIAEASVDGGPFVPIDLLHSYSQNLHYPRTVIFQTELKEGKHNLILRVSKEPKSAGHAMRIMQFVAN